MPDFTKRTSGGYHHRFNTLASEEQQGDFIYVNGPCDASSPSTVPDFPPLGPLRDRCQPGRASLGLNFERGHPTTFERDRSPGA